MTAGMNPQDSEPTPTGYVTGIADGNLATPVKLGDYLVGVSVMFRLPKRNRKKERAEAAKAEAAARPKVRIPVRMIAMGLLPLVLATAGYYAWTGYLASQPLPPEAAGTWSTNDGRYAGRNFWLTESSVAFQNGATTDRFSVHPVKRVQTRQVADTTFLSIDYEQDGEAATLSLAFREIPRPEMRLVNQPAVRWLRTGDAPVMH